MPCNTCHTGAWPCHRHLRGERGHPGMGGLTQQAVPLASTLGIPNIKLLGCGPHPLGNGSPSGQGSLAGPLCSSVDQAQTEGSPFTTSVMQQLGSMLPMCLGCAGLVLPSKIRAVGGGAAVGAAEPAGLPLPQGSPLSTFIPNASDPKADPSPPACPLSSDPDPPLGVL